MVTARMTDLYKFHSIDYISRNVQHLSQINCAVLSFASVQNKLILPSKFVAPKFLNFVLQITQWHGSY